jgi:MFS family permease
VGFGGGVFLGGILADRVGVRGGWRAKLRVCLAAALLIIPAASMMNLHRFEYVLAAIPLYFALSGIVTAVGFSTMLDIVPNRSRGLAISISFFLNVAVGAGVGPTAVALTGSYLFGAQAGLGPPLSLTAAAGYLIVVAALVLTLRKSRPT